MTTPSPLGDDMMTTMSGLADETGRDRTRLVFSRSRIVCLSGKKPEVLTFGIIRRNE
jgi:hypothetical protein